MHKPLSLHNLNTPLNRNHVEPYQVSGACLEREFSDASSRSHVYGIANLYYQFMGDTRVNVSETPFSSGKQRVWAGVGIGGSYNWNKDQYSLYGEISYNTSLENIGNSYSVKGFVGVRFRW